MFERRYHIGRRSVFNGRACLFASVRAFKCIRVIPRRHSRRLDAFSNSRRVFSLSMPRCTDHVGPRCSSERCSDQRCNVAVVKRKTVSTHWTFRHGRERPWIPSKSPSNISIPLSRLILLFSTKYTLSRNKRR